MIAEFTVLGALFYTWIMFMPGPTPPIFQDDLDVSLDFMNVLWQLSIKTYCTMDRYHTMPFTNIVSGFTYDSTIYWSEYDI